MKVISFLVALFFIVQVSHAKSNFRDLLNYSTSGDVFNLLSTLNEELKKTDDGVIKKYWISRFGLSREEKSHLENFNIIRLKYKQQFTPFDKFSLAFYRSQSVDEAVKKLSKFLKSEDLKTVVKSLRALRANAQKIIGESSIFQGKIEQVQKKRKRQGVTKAYNKLFKFFSYKRSYKTKIFFTWWPSDRKPQVEFIQNVVFIRISPLKDIETFLSKDRLISILVKSLFMAQSPNQIKSMEKIIYKDCKQRDIETSLYNAMGKLYLESLIQRKKFDPMKLEYDSKRDQALTLLFFDLFDRQMANRAKFYGNFVNNVAKICTLIP